MRAFTTVVILSFLAFGDLRKRAVAASPEEVRQTVHRFLTRNIAGTITAQYTYNGEAKFLRFETDGYASLGLISKEMRPLKGDVIFTGMYWFGESKHAYWELDSDVVGRLTIVPSSLKELKPALTERAKVVMDNVLLFKEWPYSFWRLGLPGCDAAPYVWNGATYANTNLLRDCRVTAEITETTDSTAVLSAKLVFPTHTIGRIVRVIFEEKQGKLVPKRYYSYPVSDGRSSQTPTVTTEFLELGNDWDSALLTPEGLFRPGLGEVNDYRGREPEYVMVDPGKKLYVTLGPLTFKVETVRYIFWFAAGSMVSGTVLWRAARKKRKRQD